MGSNQLAASDRQRRREWYHKKVDALKTTYPNRDALINIQFLGIRDATSTELGFFASSAYLNIHHFGKLSPKNRRTEVMKEMCILWKSQANGENNLYAEVRRANQWLNEEALRIFDVQPLYEKSETISSAPAEQRDDCDADTEPETTPAVRRRSKRGRDNEDKSIEIIASSRFNSDKEYTECTINIGPFGFHGVAQETKYNDYYNYYFHWGQNLDIQSISEMSESWGISNFKSQRTEDWSALGGPCCVAHAEFLVFEKYVHVT